jgi:hypothetical protein
MTKLWHSVIVNYISQIYTLLAGILSVFVSPHYLGLEAFEVITTQTDKRIFSKILPADECADLSLAFKLTDRIDLINHLIPAAILLSKTNIATKRNKQELTLID